MPRLVLIFITLFFPILIGYASSIKNITSFFQDRNVVAWNEDYVNSYVFALPKGNNFSYEISRKNGLKDTITDSYKGTFGFQLIQFS